MVSQYASAEGSPFIEFEEELIRLLNKHSIDSYCNIHDFILSDYIIRGILAFHHANERKEKLTKND